jgi:hypothetical protein
MRPIWKLAGFVYANGMHYNPRTVVKVPEELARLTPIARWAIHAFSNVEQSCNFRAGASQIYRLQCFEILGGPQQGLFTGCCNDYDQVSREDLQPSL